MPFTTVTANKLINKLLRNTDFVHPSAIYVSLHTADPTQTGASEVTGGGYTRVVSTFVNPTTKVTENVADVEFTDMPAVTVTHIGLWDAVTGGNFWWGGELAISKTIAVEDTIKILASALDVTLV